MNNLSEVQHRNHVIKQALLVKKLAQIEQENQVITLDFYLVLRDFLFYLSVPYSILKH